MSTELIINASLPETRIAMMENGEIQDLLIERASGKGIVGNIYKGRVTRVLPGMQAAFVDIGLEKAAFLYVDDVFVHSEIWEEEEGAPDSQEAQDVSSTSGANDLPVPNPLQTEGTQNAEASVEGAESPSAAPVSDAEVAQWEREVSGEDEGEEEDSEEGSERSESSGDRGDEFADDADDEDEDDDDQGPVGMSPPPGEGDEGSAGGGDPQGTVRPPAESSSGDGESSSAGTQEASGDRAEGTEGAEGSAQGGEGARRRHRRGRRGGKFRRRNRTEGGSPEGKNREGQQANAEPGTEALADSMPEMGGGFEEDSDRSAFSEQTAGSATVANDPAELAGRPEVGPSARVDADRSGAQGGKRRPEFKEPRNRDRKIRPKQAARSVRTQANIQDLLKEGQEVIVQVAKDPISTKGARLTCHISLPGRHLVCMPTIDHVGVSRRIERDDERRKLREYVERYRPKNLGFIVRTASGRQQSERRIKQDIEYLTRLWSEIREKAGAVTAPALVYEDLNSVLRAIRDWVTEDIDKVIVDSRYHYNDILRFVSHFMPSLKQKVELYHGDVPIFDAYNISTELARGLERKVWLKSGGYLVIDQAEALVAVDVNTGRFVGKKNLEDTILKTNLEAVQEIAYQLRLRNCGGIIILDLIDMEREENKQRVYRALEEALKKDRARPTILKISELGLVEMTRKRTRDTMVRALCESCSHCEGKGYVKSKQTVAYEVLRELERVGIEGEVGKVLVQAHADVIDILAIEERDTLDQLERRYRKQFFLQAVADYHMERFEIVGDKREKGERGFEPSSQSEDRNRNGQSRDRDRDRGRNRGRGRDRGRGRNEGPIQAGVDGADYRGEASRGGASQLPKPLPRPISLTPQVVESADPSSQASESSENLDFRAEAPRQNLAAPVSQVAGSPDGFYDEEDRLAFLRAQAAQDAALARLNANGAGGVDPRRGPGAGQSRGQGFGGGGGGGLGRAPQERGGGDRDRSRRRRGRRGGRFRRDEPVVAGQPGEVPRQPAVLPRPLDAPRPAIEAAAPSNEGAGHSSGGSGNGNGGGGGDTGGGDHSNPPT